MDDEKMMQFRKEFNEHVEDCEKRFSEGDKQFKKLIDVTNENTEAVTLLIDETREVIQIYKDIQGAARIGKGVQSFGIWVIKWPLIGGGLYALFNWIIEHLPR